MISLRASIQVRVSTRMLPQSSRILRAQVPTRMASQILRQARRLLCSDANSKAPRPPSLNHVALAVPSLSAATTFYRDVLSLAVSDPQPLPAHGVTVSFVNAGETNIELLEPLGDSSPIANFLNARPKGGMHHLCIDVDDLPAAIAALQKHGVRTLSEMKIGAHGKNIVFLHPADAFGSLIELQQR